MRNLLVVVFAATLIAGTAQTAQSQNIFRFTNGIASQSLSFSKPVQVEPLKSVSLTNPIMNSVVAATNMAFKAATTITVNAGKAALNLTEQATRSQFKFALILNREVEALTNTKLFSFLDEWWATKYLFGGTTKRGIDCSAFTGLLMKTVYSFKMPRTAREQYGVCEKIKNKEDLKEGDLVFFNTRGGVSHVGFYLGDGYFAHASSSKGVTVNNLSEKYYAARYISGGRYEAKAAETKEDETAPPPSSEMILAKGKDSASSIL